MMRFGNGCCLLLVGLIAACGGGHGGAPAVTEFEGSVTKGPLDGGMLRIDDDRGGMQTVPIGTDSRVTGSVTGPGGFKCRAYDGGFIDESTGLRQVIPFQFALLAIFFSSPGTRVDLNVSVLTTLVFWRLQFLLAARPGLAPAEAYDLACEQYGLLGFGRGNPVPAPTSGDALRAWLLTVGLSELAAALGVETPELVHWFALDGMDGRFDGFACGMRIQLTAGTYPVDALNAYKTNLLDFLADNPNNTSGITDTDALVVALCDTINAHLDGGTGLLDNAPFVQDVYPAFGSTAGGDTISVTGQFNGPLTTEWWHSDGTTSTVPETSNDGQRAEFPTPPAPPGISRVRVMDTEGLFDVFPFTYSSAPLTVSGLAPPNGPVVGGTLVKITGTGFRMGAPPAVSFGGRAATVYRVASDTCLYVFSPEGATTGTVVVDVGGAGGPIFQYQDPLVQSSPNPASFWNGEITLRDEGAQGTWQGFIGRATFPAGQVTGNGAELDVNAGSVSRGVMIQNVSDPLPPMLLGSLDGPNYGVMAVDADTTPPQLQGTVVQQRRVGIRVVSSVSTSTPVVDGEYYVAGLCAGVGGSGTLQGKATFDRARGKLLVRGLVSERPRGMLPDLLNTIVASADFSVATDGRLNLSGFDPDPGIGLVDGFVAPDGAHGMLLLATDDAFYTMMFGRCPTGVADFGETNVAGAMLELPGSGAEAVKANQLIGHHEGLRQWWRCDMRCRFDPLGGPPTSKEEFLIEDGFFVDGFGSITSKKGNKLGFLTEGGVVLSLPGLPFWGYDDSGDFGVEPGFGGWAPVTPFYTSKSILYDYNVLATGIELSAAAGPITPNPYERTSQLLGVARRAPTDVILVCDEPFDLATKFEFDIVKEKRVTRDQNRVVSTLIGTPQTMTGFAYTFIGNKLILLPCPFGGQTNCLFKGFPSGNGEIVLVGNSEGIDESWCGTCVRQSTVAPPVAGGYDLRFLLTQAAPATGDLFAAQGQGGITFGSGTYTMSYTQFSVRDDLFTGFPTGPFTIPGTFTVDATGRIDMVQDFGGGSTAPLCGIVSRNGGTLFLLGPAPGALSTTYALVRTDTVTGQLPFAGAQMYCGLELDFLGAGGLRAATRMGALVTRTSSLDLVLDRVVRTNLAAGFTRTSESMLGLAGTFTGRTYSVTAPGPRMIDGAIGTSPPAVGSQIDRRAETSLDVSTR